MGIKTCIDKLYWDSKYLKKLTLFFFTVLILTQLNHTIHFTHAYLLLKSLSSIHLFIYLLKYPFNPSSSLSLIHSHSLFADTTPSLTIIFITLSLHHSPFHSQTFHCPSSSTLLLTSVSLSLVFFRLLPFCSLLGRPSPATVKPRNWRQLIVARDDEKPQGVWVSLRWVSFSLFFSL